jgi:FMN reductase
MVVATGVRRPLVVGIGGTGRLGSTTERALALALRGAEDGGAEVHLFGGAFLSQLPLFQPHLVRRSPRTLELLDAVARADGLIVASPSYHGGVSAMVKNALDHMEDLREDARPYLDRRAVGCVVTSAGCQAGGTTLSALRSIVHALRGWPTPLGAAVSNAAPTLGADGRAQQDAVDRHAVELHTVGHQVAEFASLFGPALPTVAGVSR